MKDLEFAQHKILVREGPVPRNKRVASLFTHLFTPQFGLITQITVRSDAILQDLTPVVR
jgi:hypothetical protein